MNNDIFDGYPDPNNQNNNGQNNNGRPPFYFYNQPPPPPQPPLPPRNGLAGTKTAIVVILLLVAIFGALGIGYIIGGAFGGLGETDPMAEEMPELYQVYQYIKRYYIEDLNWEEFQYAAINGLLDALDDPYSWLDISSPNDYSKQLGIMFHVTEYNEYYVDKVAPGSAVADYNETVLPEEKLERGDIIISVDGTKINNLNSNSASFIAALADDELTLEFVKAGANGFDAENFDPNNPDPLQFEVVEATIKKQYPSAAAEKVVNYDILTDKNGKEFFYLEFLAFDDAKSDDEEYLAILQMDEAISYFLNPAVQAKVEGRMMLDLRQNGGGSVDVAAAVAPYFVKDKSKNTNNNVFLMEMKYRDGSGDSFYTNAKKYDGQPREYLGDALPNFKLSVLVGGNSASASEVLVANMMYYSPEHAIVGQQTYGKGVAQRVFKLENPNYRIVLQCAEYFVYKRNEKTGATEMWNYQRKPKSDGTYEGGIAPEISTGNQPKNNLTDEEPVIKAAEWFFE